MSNSKPSKITLVLALIVLGATGYYGYTRFNELTDVNEQLALADNILLELEQESGDALDEYTDAKKDYVETYDANTEKISTILPYDEDLTSLTRVLDDFAFENHYSSNPFFISQMSYGTVTETEDGYRVLPINMTVEASEKNFNKFLEFIETSGSLESGVRLMSVETLTLQVNEDDETMRVQLSLNAYLQSA
ncbi:hypothetical protein HN748_04325 [Candidatus Peregrinibacteria bacterium]|jgi:hypothetical protein|nr:hypothetical protein [Candidatus Peregrinibacteria bacterium]MBT7483839.1 hypothetical protein [Candidatus Peregrinibacteria bacterium]MBT7703436.1 hypothetical protein [Candidatus Peregrinibacteria bacterium]